MPELRSLNQSSARSSGTRGRDASPDSVIYTLESNFTLFSSASASVDRCSFASDAHDRESLASDVSLQMAGHDGEHQESSSGPDLDPNKPAVHIKHSRLPRKREKVKVQKELNSHADFEDLDQTLDSARNSFSLALKECQERRSRSDAFLKKPDRRRPASVDLNNVNTFSPRFGMIKSSTTARRTGTFPSPGTPNYPHTMQKGWSSERVPLHNNAGRRHVSTALLPYTHGRALPSKWEDAERWIFSPVSAECPLRAAHPQPHRRPKSKSGPLGPPGSDYGSLYSPAAHAYGGNIGQIMENSPFSAGVITADGLTIQSCDHSRAFPVQTACMARSASVHGCSETPSLSILAQDSGEKHDGFKDAATLVYRAVSRRDMATQMSPEGSTHSSPDMRASFTASTSSALPIIELQNSQPSKMEVRDVQVDGRVTVTRWSKKNKIRIPRKNSEAVDNWKQKGDPLTWDVSEAAKSISKVTREEARITAWENLQKAKAEAAIRKLEMKLEKKRSSSMDKIMNKLKLAQKRAQEMRSSVLANQAHQVARTSQKAVSLRRNPQMSSLSGCFTCHAF